MALNTYKGKGDYACTTNKTTLNAYKGASRSVCLTDGMTLNAYEWWGDGRQNKSNNFYIGDLPFPQCDNSQR